jgi:hypothetical protein
MRKLELVRLVLSGVVILGLTPWAGAMCGYFAPPIAVDVKQPAVLQPSQIAFITWDPVDKMETVTVQPRFEGNALDFGMVIPTPSQPRLHEMPRDFFKALGVATQPKRRVIPESKLMPQMFGVGRAGAPGAAPQNAAAGGEGGRRDDVRPSTVTVLEVGQVGNLDYKIINAERADDLYQWLKDHKYSFAGDEGTLNYYVQKKYVFTVMKIDTLQMKKNKDGSYTGDVTPTRFTFGSEQLVYPLKITQVSVKDKTDALFYVQAPYKVDLPGDLSWQFHWLSLLQHTAKTFGPNDLIEPNRNWLQSVAKKAPKLTLRGGELGFSFPLGQELPANKAGHRPSSLEWAKLLTADDIGILTGDRPYSEIAPDPDFGFTRQDLNDPKRGAAVMKVIQSRLQKYQTERPRGYRVREATKDELQTLAVLKGHLQADQVLTKFYHTFTRDEMNQDLVMVQAKSGDIDDRSEHEEVQRTLIFGGRGPRFPLPGGAAPPPAAPGLE